VESAVYNSVEKVAGRWIASAAAWDNPVNIARGFFRVSALTSKNAFHWMWTKES
jgi:hypothetical protein